MFKFTLTITTSVFLLMSGAVNVFAMDVEDDNKALVITHYVPQDVMGVILKEASKDHNPRHLTSICKLWYNIIRENQDSQGKQLRYSDMNPFMKELMQTYWESRFYKGVLEYTSPSDGKKIRFQFLDLKDSKDGTFNLSTCGDTGNYLVITINSDRFFEIEGANKDKTVTGIMPYHWIEEIIKSKPDHPLASFMADWDPDIAPVGMFWRWGNDKNLTWVDAQTMSTMKAISSKNLYKNWTGTHGGTRAGGWRALLMGGFHVNF